MQAKALAELVARELGKKAYCQSVFPKLYRRFGINIYGNIRQDQYQKAPDFFGDWQESVMEQIAVQEKNG